MGAALSKNRRRNDTADYDAPARRDTTSKRDIRAKAADRHIGRKETKRENERVRKIAQSEDQLENMKRKREIKRAAEDDKARIKYGKIEAQIRDLGDGKELPRGLFGGRFGLGARRA